MHPLINLLILASTTQFGSNLASLVQSIIGPIFLTAVGVISITFLVRREMTKFMIFLLIAILVAAVIYVPSMIQNLGSGAGNSLSNTW